MIFLPHAKPENQSCWVALLRGQITAAGAPPPQSLGRWAGQGVTDVVTLLRADEIRYPMGDSCETLGMGWHHLPLSGRRLEAKADVASLERMGEVAALLGREPGRRVVVHCAAGMHRTGVSLYLIARCAGLTPSGSVQLIEQARGLTARELVRPTAGGVLLDQAEGHFQRIFCGERAWPAREGAGPVRPQGVG
jgi:hypothetical protein